MRMLWPPDVLQRDLKEHHPAVPGLQWVSNGLSRHIVDEGQSSCRVLDCENRTSGPRGLHFWQFDEKSAREQPHWRSFCGAVAVLSHFRQQSALLLPCPALLVRRPISWYFLQSWNCIERDSKTSSDHILKEFDYMCRYCLMLPLVTRTWNYKVEEKLEKIPYKHIPLLSYCCCYLTGQTAVPED